MKKNRYLVIIRCKDCGERFTLRGKISKKGEIDTGFKQCICGNTDDFDITKDSMG